MNRKSKSSDSDASEEDIELNEFMEPKNHSSQTILIKKDENGEIKIFKMDGNEENKIKKLNQM